jgi:hypothetical protein
VIRTRRFALEALFHRPRQENGLDEEPIVDSKLRSHVRAHIIVVFTLRRSWRGRSELESVIVRLSPLTRISFGSQIMTERELKDLREPFGSVLMVAQEEVGNAAAALVVAE